MKHIKLLLLVLVSSMLAAALGVIATMYYVNFARGASSEIVVMLADRASAAGDLAKAESYAYDAIGANPRGHLGYVAVGHVFELRGEVCASRAALQRALYYLDVRSGNRGLLEDDEASRLVEVRAIQRKLDKLPAVPQCDSKHEKKSG